MAGTGDKLMTASEIKEVTDTKLIKDFSSLTALSGTPSTGDLVPIKSGNDTYKIDYNALASAILGQISSNGVVNVANGGTGSNSATGALSGLIGALDTSSGFSLSDTIPVSINGTAYTITGRTLSNAIGGGGTEQSALTNYVKNCGTISSLPATIQDENITADMVLLAYSLGTPSAMGSNWSVATDEGEIEITGTLSGSTTLTLTFGVGYSVAPTILTDLSSTTPDNILKANPRPGVTGTLPIANGGTGAASASAARTALDVYSKSETTSAISQSTANLKKIYRFTISSGAVAANANCPLADSYASDNLVYRDGNTIKFGFSGVVLLNIHLAAQSDNASTKRLWAKLNGANASVQMLVYGAYATADLSQVVQVDTSTAISLQAIEPFTVNGGSTGVSNIFVTILG